MSQQINNEVMSQDSYEPTQYEDSSWEVVGELVETKEFVPMAIKTAPRSARYVDPMFANYGGIPEESEQQRWHLPEDLSVSYRAKVNKVVSDEPEEPTVTMLEVELAAIKQAAFDEGRLAGLEDAVQGNAERINMVEQRLVQVLQDLQGQIQEHVRRIERRAVELSLHIARKLVGDTVEINPEYIIQIVREALGLAGGSQVKSVRISPQDFEFIQLVGAQTNLKEHDGSWNFIPDPAVRAGCIVETSAGQIDFQLDIAWQRIQDKVVRLLK